MPNKNKGNPQSHLDAKNKFTKTQKNRLDDIKEEPAKGSREKK